LLALPCSYDHANIKSTAGPAESPYRHRYLAALPNSWHSPYAHTLGDTHNNTYTLYSITSPRSLYRPYLLAGYHRLIYIHYTRLRVPNASVASRIRGGIPALSAVIEPRRCYPCYITSTHDSAACHLAPVAEPAIPASSAVTWHQPHESPSQSCRHTSIDITTQLSAYKHAFHAVPTCLGSSFDRRSPACELPPAWAQRHVHLEGPANHSGFRSPYAGRYGRAVFALNPALQLSPRSGRWAPCLELARTSTSDACGLFCCDRLATRRLHDISELVASVGDNNLFHMLFVRYCVAQCAVEVVEV
jgi:hypothetical protein